MKQFGAFIIKEYYHIFRDKRTMLILLAMPLVQLLLFGFAITTEVRNVNVAILDPAKDISTQRIVDRINASEYFNTAFTVNNSVEIEDAFKSGKVNLAIVFSNNFHQSLFHTNDAKIQLIADGTDPNQARMQVQYLTGILMAYQQELIEESNIPYRIQAEQRMLYNPQNKSAYNFVPGVMGLIIMLICAMMTSISIVREKETGTMEVLLTSPVKPIYIIVAKAVPYFTISVINLITILLLSYFVLDVPLAGNLLALLGVSLLYILVNLTLGLLISNVVNNQVGAIIISGMGLMMPVMLLSGMIFEIASMPLVLQWISNILPAKWYIMSIKKLMISGLSITTALKEVGVLCFMLMFLIAVNVKKFKTRLE